jgi:hypothetical protein
MMEKTEKQISRDDRFALASHASKRNRLDALRGVEPLF